MDRDDDRRGIRRRHLVMCLRVSLRPEWVRRVLLKDALPLSVPAHDRDDPMPEASEPMKGGLPATATGASEEAPVREGVEEPKD